MTACLSAYPSVDQFCLLVRRRGWCKLLFPYLAPFAASLRLLLKKVPHIEDSLLIAADAPTGAAAAAGAHRHYC